MRRHVRPSIGTIDAVGEAGHGESSDCRGTFERKGRTMSTEVAQEGTETSADVGVDDPREAIEVGVLRANGRLAGRRFASRAEAAAWARPEDGDRVVEFNVLCECSFTS
jgi:hypothetical protein